MGTLRLAYTRVSVAEDYGGSTSLNSLTPVQFGKFDETLLGLGDLASQSTVTNALAAVFDLEGFTGFCSQIDPQLVVPEYLSEFLQWLFAKIRQRFVERETPARVRLWGSLPFYAKFTGDGVLLLWDTDLSGGMQGCGNIAIQLRNVCTAYASELRPKLQASLANTPTRLRVGIARGQVFSVGDGNDFVGPCINLAARLQKLESLSFAVSRRGFDPVVCFSPNSRALLTTKRLRISGVGEDERVLVLKDEFEALSVEEMSRFQ